MSNPLLSIIIPVYNVSNYLESCLDNVLAGFQDTMELICVDDASTDESPDILKKYKTIYPHLQIIYHSENKGMGATRNTGIRHAKGDYLYFLDSDDFILPTTLPIIAEALSTHQPDLLYFSSYAFDRQTNNIFLPPPYGFLTFPPGNRQRIIVEDDFQKLLRKKPAHYFFGYGVIYCVGNKVFKKEIVKDYFPENIVYEDVPFFYRSLLRTKKRLGLFDQHAVFFYRLKRPGSVTTGEDFDYKKISCILKSGQLSFQLFRNDSYLQPYLFVNILRMILPKAKNIRERKWVFRKEAVLFLFRLFKTLSLYNKCKVPVLFLYYVVRQLFLFKVFNVHHKCNPPAFFQDSTVNKS